MFGYSVTSLYSHARSQGRRGQIRSLLTGRSRRLLTLDEVCGACTAYSRHRRPGVQMVPLDRIRGSESRNHDFDCDFNPLQNHSEQRWLRVAAAREQGKSLSPVRLIQVGDIYFVRDGHHRISVAQALGQPEIEAEVEVWQVGETSPWKQAATSGRLAWQPA